MSPDILVAAAIGVILWYSGVGVVDLGKKVGHGAGRIEHGIVHVFHKPKPQPPAPPADPPQDPDPTK